MNFSIEVSNNSYSNITKKWSTKSQILADYMYSMFKQNDDILLQIQYNNMIMF